MLEGQVEASVNRVKVEQIVRDENNVRSWLGGSYLVSYPEVDAVQQTHAGEVNWIIDTKGREYDDVAHKGASITS